MKHTVSKKLYRSESCSHCLNLITLNLRSIKHITQSLLVFILLGISMRNVVIMNKEGKT